MCILYLGASEDAEIGEKVAPLLPKILRQTTSQYIGKDLARPWAA